MKTIELKSNQVIQNANGVTIKIIEVNGKKEFGGWKGMVWYQKISNHKVTNHRQSIVSFKASLSGYEEVISEIWDAKLAEIAEVEAYEASQL